jgi:nucleotide-binding universal stress UspA family protein
LVRLIRTGIARDLRPYCGTGGRAQHRLMRPYETELSPPVGQVPVAIKTVLVATDGSALAERAFAPASWLAARTGAALELLTVAAPGRFVDAATRIDGVAPGRFASRRILVGDDAADVLAAAITTGEGTVGCLATRARNRSAPVLGSTAQAVLERTWEPLLVVGPRADAAQHAGPVVVAVGGHPDDEDLVGVGSSWAARLGRDLIVVTVAEHALDDGEVRPTRGPADPDTYVAALSGWTPDGERHRSRVAFDPISMSDGLVPMLNRLGPSLVVAGHHRHGRVRQVLAGDHTAQVVAVAPAPVLAVPLGLHR